MTRIRAVTWLILVVAITAAAVLVATRLQASMGVEFSDDAPAPMFTGLYGAERSPDGLTYAWSRPTFGFTVPGLDRSHPWTVTVRYRAARPDESTPAVTIAVDGIVSARDVLPHDFTERRIDLPVRSGSAATQLAITIEMAYVPDGDPRALGALVDWIHIEPTDASGWVWPTMRTWMAMMPLLLLPLCWALTGVPLGSGLLVWAFTVIGAAVVVTHGAGPYSEWSTWMPAAASLVTGLLPWLLIRRIPAAALVGAITTAFVCVKVLTLVHPAMPTGDAVFHAHRLQTVLAGDYFFTSVTPGNYAFPYAPGLYVAAIPFAGWTETVADKVVLLRVLTTCAEAMAVAGLLVLAMRWRKDAAIGVAAVVAYHALPLSFGVLAVGNLTNVFAQGLALGALVVAAYMPLRMWAVATLGAVALAACLSHTSTFAVLNAQLGLLALTLFVARRHPALRRSALQITAIGVGVIVVSIAAYYGHFADVYREAFGRVAHDTQRATDMAGGRTPMMRLLDVPRLLELYYTWPGLLLVAVGMRTWWTDPDRPSVASFVLMAATLACLVFVVLGILTPVDMRHYLAAIPMVALLAAAGLVTTWRQGGAPRWVGCALALWLMATGVTRWFSVLG